jgi:hypothetical protein
MEPYHRNGQRPYKTFGLGYRPEVWRLLLCPEVLVLSCCVPPMREGPLRFLELFRRRAPIRDAQGLAEFIDRQSAFLVQKGIYEYSRARAGHYSKVLFAEAGFQNAVEQSRWRAYPLGLAMVAEVVEGVLRPYGADRNRQLDAVSAVVLSVFDRYPIPAALGEEAWSEARVELVRQLQLIGLHAPKRAFDICEPWAETYFNLMPIHEKLRRAEFPTIRNYLKVTLCNIHDEFTRRLDVTALSAALHDD